MSIRNMAVLTDVMSWPDLVQCQPPDGNRLASGFLVGTDAIVVFLISRAFTKKMLLQIILYKPFCQRTCSDTKVFLRFNKLLRVIKRKHQNWHT